MNTKLNPTAQCYVGVVNGRLACFTGVISMPLHAQVKRIHRLVVLPEFQGIGLGTSFVEEIARVYAIKGWDVVLTTSTPALTYSLNRNDNWQLISKGRTNQNSIRQIDKRIDLAKTSSGLRIIYSFKYVPPFEIKMVIE